MHTVQKKFFVVAALLIACSFLLVPKARASTTVSSNIAADTTWGAAGSPYVLTTQIQVAKGVTLTIEPGVTVESSVNFATLNVPQYGGIGLVFIGGSLVADGTPAAPIHIDTVPVGLENSATGDIAYATVSAIVMGFSKATLNSVATGALNANGHNTIAATNTTITGASVFQTFIAAESVLTMSGGSIDSYDPNKAYAIEFSGAQGSLTNTTIQSATVGMLMTGSFVNAENVIIEDCATGIQLKRDPAATGDNNDLWLKNSEVSYNAVGVSFNGKPAFVDTGDSFHDNAAGVSYTDTGTSSFTFKGNWWGDPSGPFNSVNNPSGKGNSVTNTITAAPWLSAPPFPAIILPALVPPPAPVPVPTQPLDLGTSSATSTPVQIKISDPDPSVGVTDTDGTATSTIVSDTGTASSTASDTSDTSDTVLEVGDSPSSTATATLVDTVTAPTFISALEASPLPDPSASSADDLLDSLESDPFAPSALTPVLIVPGVLGTEMSDSSGKLWLDLAHEFTDIGDEFMDPLAFTSDLKPSDQSVAVGDIMRQKAGVFGGPLFDYSQNLITQLEGQGYVEGASLFVFPYDWRYGVNEDTVGFLAQKIAAIKAATGSDKVDIVAHSTGGLLVRRYVMDNPVTGGSIGKAIFVGVPTIGAPKAVKMLVQGDDFGIPFLADSEMKKLSRNFPVVYDLMPSAAYYAEEGSFYRMFRGGLSGASLIQALSLDQMNAHLLSAEGANPDALSAAAALHTSAFDEYDLRNSGVDLYSIEGCGTGTFGGVAEYHSSGVLGDVVSYGDVQELSGDGTVPFASADHLRVDEGKKYYALEADHGQMLGQQGISQEIADILSGGTLPVDGDLVTRDRSRCGLTGELLSVYSPLSLDITDANGDHAGMETDGVTVGDTIPNADYEIFGDHKFAYLPTGKGQRYSIKIKGTDSGAFTLTDASVDDDVPGSMQVFDDVPVTPSLSGTVSLGSTTTLTLDTDGDGTADEVLQPTETLGPEEAKDFHPPLDEPAPQAKLPLSPAVPVAAASVVVAAPMEEAGARLAASSMSSASPAILPAASTASASVLEASVIGSGAGDFSSLLFMLFFVGLPGWILLARSLIKK